MWNFNMLIHSWERTGKSKKRKLLHSSITRGLGQLYSLDGFGRPLFEGGGINNPAGSLESGELLGVSVMEEISKQGGGESSLLHQKKVEGLWNICSSLSHFMCSSWKGITERENILRNWMRRQGKKNKKAFHTSKKIVCNLSVL